MKADLDVAASNPRMEPIPHAPVAVSVVVIGRNEGERLARCLASVRAARWNGLAYELIYVDSRSSDDSVTRASAMGAQVRMLDDAAPCAAKARNVGWRLARGDFILFLDGDTELDADFVRHALATLEDARLCAAWGHRRESRPEQSLYTRVLDLDWVYPTGRTLYFGGDVLIRRAALVAVGGFDPTLKAGEEPELCARLRADGWEIEHIDAPMTRHDLAVTTLRAWWRRAYRSGIAYAEVADRMRRRGDPLWQREAARDLRHGLLFVAAPFVLLAALAWSPAAALALVALALALVARTASRCAWKAPGRTLLHWQYAVFSHAQKIPALFGQLAWRRARRRSAEIGMVEYKEDAPAAAVETAAAPIRKGGRRLLKRALTAALVPLAGVWRHAVQERWLRVWSLARLQEATGHPVHASNVVLGAVDVLGTGNVQLGRDALIYPGVHLETQGEGRIEIGDGVVLSRGVHIVAFDRVTLGDGAMIGEYSSLRDANHRLSGDNIRDSGHDRAPIAVGRNVWIGRGVTVLKGVALGDSCVVAANAVVTRRVAAGTVVGGVPAAVLKTTSGVHAVDADHGGFAAAPVSVARA
jgi:acetyltransferase-like isoleucine patch superfamily enzyme/GT2 family glycosyltransferase